MLIQAAANEWKVPAAECRAANSVITHAPTGRTTTYGKVAAAAAKLEPPKDVALKDPKDWKIAGKPVKRLDTADKLTGKQIYGTDLKLPGMLNAAIKDCPVFGGKVKSFDAAAVQSMPGVKKVVQVETSPRSRSSPTPGGAPRRRSTRCRSNGTRGRTRRSSSASIAEWLKAGLDANDAVVGNQNGDAKAGARRRRRRRSRPSTPTRTRTTRRWSR